MIIKIDYKDIKIYGLNPSKRSALTLADRYFFRLISDAIAPVLFNVFNLTPNRISVLSLIVAFIGFILIGSGSTSFALAGVGFLIFWAVLDCSDGSIARTLNCKYNIKNPLGEFFDALAGYFLVAGLWFSVGLYLYLTTSDPKWMILGGLSSIAGLYARVSYVKLAAVKCRQGIDEKGNPRKSFSYFIYENLEFGSFLLPVLFLSLIFNFSTLVLVFYLLLNLIMVAWLFRHAYQNTKKYPLK